jgi:hypothetical protein
MAAHLQPVSDLDAAHPDGALERAFAQLSRGGDLQLVLAMARALVRAGVAGLAARLLGALAPQLAGQPEIASLRDQLARLPSGEVPSEQCRRTFDANIAVLRDAPCAWEAVAALRVFRTLQGNVCAVRDEPAGRMEIVLPLVDAEANAARLVLPPVEVGSAYLLAGVPGGPLLRRLMALRTDSGFEPPIDVLEPNPDALAAWLSAQDLAEVLAGPRVAILAGPRAVERYRAFLLDYPNRAQPTMTVLTGRPDLAACPLPRGFFAEVRPMIAARRRKQYESQADAYSRRGAARWAERFGAVPTRPAIEARESEADAAALRVAGFTTRYSTVIRHAMRDLAAAFRRRGCSSELLCEPDPHSAQVDTWSTLARGEVDLVIVINHLRSELKEQVSPNVPFVCWIQDYMQPLWSREAAESIGEFDLVMGHSPALMTSVYGYPADRFIATSNLTDAYTYSADPVPRGDADRHRCDIAFVSHGSEPVEVLIQQLAGRSQPMAAWLTRFVELVRRRLAERCGLTFMDQLELMLQAERDSGHPAVAPARRAAIVLPAAQKLCDRVIRHQTLEWAAAWVESRRRILAVYGRGWERNPAFARYARGEIGNGYPLRCLYQAAVFSLQANGYASLHPRLLDGFAAGATVVSRYNHGDWTRVHVGRLAAAIEERGIASLEQLAEAAAASRELAALRDAAETVLGYRLAPSTNPRRRDEIAIVEQAGIAPAPIARDDTLFKSIQTLSTLAARVAGEIDGFGELTFRTSGELHALLDRLAADADARRVLAERARACILRHDTYDVLVERIIRHFASRFAAADSQRRPRSRQTGRSAEAVA